jgi:hypothetical protein
VSACGHLMLMFVRPVRDNCRPTATCIVMNVPAERAFIDLFMF